MIFPPYVNAALLFILHWQVKFFVWSNPIWIDREIADFANTFMTGTKNKPLKLLLKAVIFIDNRILWAMSYPLEKIKIFQRSILIGTIRERSIAMAFRIH